jgi:hypothetical protein
LEYLAGSDFVDPLQNNDPNHLTPVPEQLAFTGHDTDVQWFAERFLGAYIRFFL